MRAETYAYVRRRRVKGQGPDLRADLTAKRSGVIISAKVDSLGAFRNF